MSLENQPLTENWLGLNTVARIGNREWLSGAGKVPAPLFFLGGYPQRSESVMRSVMAGDMAREVCGTARAQGIDVTAAYFTFAVKYGLGKNPLKAADIKTCRSLLMEEIRRVKPSVIVCLGKDALSAVCGKALKFSVVRGTPVPYRLELAEDEFIDVTVFAAFNPAFLDSAPKERPAFEKEMAALKRELCHATKSTADFLKGMATITRPEDLRALRMALTAEAPRAAALDCEWHGRSWHQSGRRLRTVQLAFEDGTAVVVELYHSRAVPGGYEFVDSDPDPGSVLAELKLLLESGALRIIGHNVKEDSLWLAASGIDIRQHTVWDTMLAELLLNQAGPFGLEELALKYTDIPRWSLDLELWKQNTGPEWKRDGYGYVPAAILNPYAAMDVVATMRVCQAQIPLMGGYLEPRGEHPSLFSTVMEAQDLLQEIETEGLPVNTDVLDNFIRLFEAKSDALALDLKEKAAGFGMPEFNPDSGADVAELLFKRLGVTPFRTTKAAGGKLWQDAVAELSFDDDEAMDKLTPGTDTVSLTILVDEHPLVADLINYRKVAQIRKTWMRTPDPDGTGGLYGVTGEDGRLHSSFSMLTATGRLLSRKPNVQNFPKQAQQFLNKIFAEEVKADPWLKAHGGLPSIRNVVRPVSEDYVIIEGDFVQAELFTLAGLSGDENMMRTLTTPGLDMHDRTAVDGFSLQTYDATGTLVTEPVLLETANALWIEHGGGTPGFDKNGFDDALEHYKSGFLYHHPSGEILTRKQFKSTLRIGAKGINFGIMYGRTAPSIAIKIKSETGTKTPLTQLTQEISQMLTGWKEVSYPTAWKFLEACSESAVRDWVVTTTFGRSRRFAPTDNRRILGEYRRQGSNIKIQGTVADACLLAMLKMRKARKEAGLSFRFCNQVHDAVMVMCRKSEIRPTLDLYRATMGDVKIPVPGRDPLVLGIDLEVMDLWGRKYKGEY